MSRWWLLVVAVLVAGGLLGTLMLTDPGYVLVSWGSLAFETSLWFGLFLLLATGLVVHLASRLWRLTRRGWSSVAGIAGQRQAEKGRRSIRQGLLLWAEGDWKQSLRLLGDHAASSDLPLVNHLFAASAAQHLGDQDARDRHLHEAVAVEPGGEFAISLVRAGYLQESGQPAEALSLLRLLHARAPRHPLVARQLLASAEAAGDYALAQTALSSPALKGVLDPVVVQQTGVRLWQGRLMAESADAVWREIPAALKTEPVLMLARIDRMQAESATAEAVGEAIDAMLRQHWSTELVRRMGQLRFANGTDQLRRAEGWLAKHGQDPVLLLVLGQLALRAGDLDKAESYLKSRLRSEPGPEVAAELGRLFLRRGDAARAAEFLLQALPGEEAQRGA